MNAITLSGNLNPGFTKISNVKIYAEKFRAKNESSEFSANLITGEIDELDLNAPLAEQLFLSTFEIENIILSEPNLTSREATIKVSVDEKARNFKINLHDIKLSQYGGFIENLKVHGSFNHFNVLQQVNLLFADSMAFEKSPRFPEIFVKIKKSLSENYQAKIEGKFEEFELSDSDNFIGLLPGGNFVTDFRIDRATSKVISRSKIDATTLSGAELAGTIKVEFGSELLTNLGCSFSECELSDFGLSYKINFDGEWINGSAHCLKSFCSFLEMEHLVRTSNTVNIFTNLNQANMLNPLLSLYLFRAISSGQKINGGHELKFQF